MSQEHNTAPRRLRFGTLGWRRAEWSGSYYPEDLPEDWQLGYYANELSAVLLPPDTWRAAPPGRLSDWVDDLHPAFRVYLLADATADPGVQRARAAELGAHLGGLLWPAAPAPDDLAAPLADLPARVQAWAVGGRLSLALLDVAGLDLRGRRGLLDALGPLLTDAEGAAVILAGAGVSPTDALELQTVAELMGLA